LLENFAGYAAVFALLHSTKRVSGTGPLGAGSYRAARTFKAVAWGGLGLAAVDVAIFAAKPDLMWRGLCMCDVSIGLILLGIALLIPANMLNSRLGRLPAYDPVQSAADFRQRLTIWLGAAAAAVMGGVILYGSLVSSESKDAPDWVWWAALTAPLFPLLTWSAMVGSAVVRELRPVKQLEEVREPQGVEESLLQGLKPVPLQAREARG
jgi:hypothetical protein